MTSPAICSIYQQNLKRYSRLPGIATKKWEPGARIPWSRPGTISQETGCGEVSPCDRRGL